ncbi:hypothetical protein K469DRAFT_716536 [Zopfia rhizophila CBS 207.26]|uniref:Nucleic acid-binding protein n=1 Tax=Zopfia rhizophila CBS 207.26 TaxID=1314779 RepID=A0A6A6DIF5_9PEZI|nr:hypothetical protein K469DRAFT_716536 [Zopfia rhizophila CBS 207.26]
MAVSRSCRRLTTLNGAPLKEDLDWSEHVLLRKLDPAITAFLDEVVAVGSVREKPPPLEIKWRRILSANTRLRSGWSQPYLSQGGISSTDPSFSFSAPDPGESFELVPEDSTLLEDSHILGDTATGADTFLQHSLILHDTLLSSQLALDFGADNTISSSSFLTTSFGTTTTETSSPIRGEGYGSVVTVPQNVTVTSLSSLPTAEHLRSIHPQTPTPTLLCVLASQSPSREVQTRKSGRRMLLYEITVADETDSNFTISFWLPPCKDGDWTVGRPKEMLRQTLDGLRVGDILLLRNIALSIFRNRVYGQSLNLSITRARTTVDVLMKGNGVSSIPSNELPPGMKEKFERVKKWAGMHVVPDYKQERKRKRAKDVFKGSSRGDESLPPDTLET